MSQAAVDGLEEAACLDVASWDLNTDELVVLLSSRVGVAVRFKIDVTSNFLSQTVTHVTELLMFAVDLVRVVAVGTLASVHLEVVSSPGLGSVDWARETFNGISVKADRPLWRGRLSVNDSRHVGAKIRHLGGGVFQDGMQLGGRCDVGAKHVWNGDDRVTPSRERLEREGVVGRS